MGQVRKQKTLPLLLMAFGLFVAGCNNVEEVSDETPSETPVAVAEAVTGSLSGNNRLVGEATPGTDLDIIPKASGELIEVLVEKGDQVERGQILARIDGGEQQRALEREQGSVRQAQSALERARNGLNQAEANYQQALSSKRQAEASLTEAKQNRQNNIDSLQLELQNAQTQWDEAKKNLERMSALYQDGLISQVEYEEAVNAETRAASAYEQVRLNKSQAESEVGLASVEASVEQAEIGVSSALSSKRDAEIAVQEAQLAVEQAQLGVESAQEQLDNYVITAPANGEIVSVESRSGELVSSQAPFARLITVDVVNATVQVTAEQLMLFDIGDQIEVEFAGLEEPKQGQVAYISPTNNDSGLITVEVEVNNEARDIRPGMVATLNIEEVLVENSMIIPTAAVVERQEETYVFVVEDGAAVRKDVEVVRFDTEFTAITGDIMEGAEVVIKGQNLLSDGDLVRIIEEDN